MRDLPVPDLSSEVVYELIKHSKYVAYHNDDVGYNMEDYIDIRTGLTLSGLMHTSRTGDIVLSGKPSEAVEIYINQLAIMNEPSI